jgi:hypothetical protein
MAPARVSWPSLCPSRATGSPYPYRSSVSMVLWGWWEGTLTEEQRSVLMDSYDRPLDPDHARQLRSQVPGVAIVEPSREGTDGAIQWKLTAEVREFIAFRDYERRHPDWT